jgi:hypothetical protein
MERIEYQDVYRLARRAAFLAAHVEWDGAQEMMMRELHRLYRALTVLDGNEEPDLTFCCGCREEIELERGQDQYVSRDGKKYHKHCSPKPEK